MRELIGKTLEQAKNILIERGVNKIEVVYNEGGKLDSSDTRLVVKAEVSDDEATLIVSSFLLNI